MKTKKFLSIAIIATLPLTAMAENISGAMYVAPTAATQNNPAPTTNSDGPYGRINIDTDDQQHVASTAYVKGAYNSAIAAVNKLNSDKQATLYTDYGEISPDIVPNGMFTDIIDDMVSGVGLHIPAEFDTRLVSATAIANAMGAYDGALKSIVIPNAINSKRVEIYTTWENDNAKQQVAFVNAPEQ